MSPRRSKSRSPRPARELLARLDSLARNLRWTWDADTQRLFAALDPRLWDLSHRNPLTTLAGLPPQRLADLAAAPAFVQQLVRCESELRDYLSAKTWFARAHRRPRVKIAYFCAEFALHECLPQYAGGLGVLAGDHLKSASDLGVPLVGVGLLYRTGYYEQRFNADGSTRAVFPHLDFTRLPIARTGKTVRVPMGRGRLAAHVWRAQVGRVPLYLLDSDHPDNRPADRRITESLYGGDQETRIRQEILLGIGGVLALEAVGEAPTVFHLNEGHAAFCALERLRRLHKQGADPDAALEKVRRSTVFTTHTPVPAGHDRFPLRLVRKHLAKFLGAVPESLQKSWLDLGREAPEDATSGFCMTVLGMQASAHRNGVSRIHGQVTRDMWAHLFADRPTAVEIGHVTNGVHTQTWLAPEAEPLYRKYLKPRWSGATPGDTWAERATRIPQAELWALRNLLRSRLVMFIRRRLVEQIERRLGPTEALAAAYETFNEHALTVGFARRFATYKRAPLIFRDAGRIARLLGDTQRPVQLVFAGKAHPRDAGGQAFARQIYRFAHSAKFAGRVVVLENYDMEVGRLLTSGCDVWLNNPLPPQEASGTSGMKPPLHGGLNCSILDGWWPEAFNGKNGWAIGDSAAPSGRADKNEAAASGSRAARDRRDAASIYDLLERSIIPAFYDRDSNGVPRKWVRMMAESLRTVANRFSSHRMVGEYVENYYLAAATGR